MNYLFNIDKGWGELPCYLCDGDGYGDGGQSNTCGNGKGGRPTYAMNSRVFGDGAGYGNANGDGFSGNPDLTTDTRQLLYISWMQGTSCV